MITAKMKFSLGYDMKDCYLVGGTNLWWRGGIKFGRERLPRRNEKIFCQWWGCSHLPSRENPAIGLFRFNVDTYDIFLLDSTCDIACYADDNMPYTSKVSEYLVINKLENSCSDLFK